MDITLSHRSRRRLIRAWKNGHFTTFHKIVRWHIQRGPDPLHEAQVLERLLPNYQRTRLKPITIAGNVGAESTIQAVDRAGRFWTLTGTGWDYGRISFTAKTPTTHAEATCPTCLQPLPLPTAKL